jgi:hypothetical protein
MPDLPGNTVDVLSIWAADMIDLYHDCASKVDAVRKADRK